MAGNRSVLVLGAGELGTAVLRALAAHAQRGANTITVLLRHSGGAEFKSLGISTLAGDILKASEADLAALFAPFHTVVGCTGMAYPPGTQAKLARAVLAARVRRYLPWQYGVDYDVIGHGSSQDLFSEQLRVRELLRQQTATSWVVISTGLFVSFLFEPAFGVVSGDRRAVRALGGWENRVTVTAPEDIGRVVAEVVWAAPEVTGVVYTAGETVSYAKVADVVEGALGAEVARSLWSVETLKEDLAKDPDNAMKKYRVVFAEGRGVAWDLAHTFNATRGMKLQNVEEWATQNLSPASSIKSHLEHSRQ